MTTVQQQKHDARAHAKSILADIDNRNTRSAAIRTAITSLDQWARAQTVLSYLTLQGPTAEPDLDPLWDLADRPVLCAPDADWHARSMTPIAITTAAASTAGPHGVRTPTGDPIDPNTLDLVLVPGLAFDLAGRRLGRGGGFYDRFLAELPAATTLVGVCFEAQLVDRVPTDPHDARVRMLITESGARTCRA